MQLKDIIDDAFERIRSELPTSDKESAWWDFIKETIFLLWYHKQAILKKLKAQKDQLIVRNNSSNKKEEVLNFWENFSTHFPGLIVPLKYVDQSKLNSWNTLNQKYQNQLQVIKGFLNRIDLEEINNNKAKENQKQNFLKKQLEQKEEEEDKKRKQLAKKLKFESWKHLQKFEEKFIEVQNFISNNKNKITTKFINGKQTNELRKNIVYWGKIAK